MGLIGCYEGTTVRRTRREDTMTARAPATAWGPDGVRGESLAGIRPNRQPLSLKPRALGSFARLLI